MPAVYMYVVDRDVGFAPNPFHGYCSLATCKPGIRSTAQTGDWIIGMGGKRLDATGKCIFAMRVTGKIDFQEYWSNRSYIDKKPVRNGSSTRLVGDNIYHRDDGMASWQQADSHHSKDDGSPNLVNLQRDTKIDKVLLSRDFFYFGSEAPPVPSHILNEIGFKNRQGHRRFTTPAAMKLVDWVANQFRSSRNRVTSDPFDFFQSEKRYPGKGSELV
jgi:Nucleotide modification associated domain 2